MSCTLPRNKARQDIEARKKDSIVVVVCRVTVEGQPWVPVGSTLGPRLLGRHPWVPAQKLSTVGPRDQFSLLLALVSEKDSEVQIWRYWVRVRGLREAGFRAIGEHGLTCARGIGVRAKHGRSGDPGLWARQ
jgi:hypothetical protein